MRTRVSSLFAAMAVTCFSATIIVASSAAPPEVAATSQLLLHHRKLLGHDIDSFRALPNGGGHNSLNNDKAVADQVVATTCNPADDFVRTSGNKFILGGRPRGKEWIAVGALLLT